MLLYNIMLFQRIKAWVTLYWQPWLFASPQAETNGKAGSRLWWLWGKGIFLEWQGCSDHGWTLLLHSLWTIKLGKQVVANMSHLGRYKIWQRTKHKQSMTRAIVFPCWIQQQLISSKRSEGSEGRCFNKQAVSYSFVIARCWMAVMSVLGACDLKKAQGAECDRSGLNKMPG